MRVGYSRVSDERQACTDPLAQARHELEKAGCDLILVEVGSGTSDADRPEFRRLRDMVLDGKATEIVCPSQDRLGRNLDLVLRFVDTCHLQGVKLLDLNGRELEIRTADGRLMTTIIGALDQHRSQLYGEKTRRHLQAAREQGFPARPRVPFGLMKVRDANGRFVAIDIDPVTGPLARQRIDWFLRDGLSLTALCQRVAQEQPGTPPLQIRQAARWLASPLLTGRLAWHKDRSDRFTQVASEQTFTPLVSDAEHEAIKVRLAASSTSRGVRGRTIRMLTGLVRCDDCGKALTYKLSGKSTWYLRCSSIGCVMRNRMVRVDHAFGVLQYSLLEHAKALVPILQRPAVDPPEVSKLQQEIEVLSGVSGAEALIETKRCEIQQLRGRDTSTPAWLLIGALRSPLFWLMDDAPLNRVLQQLLECVTVQLGATTADAVVTSVQCRTVPSEAPLPPDQKRILLKRGLPDLLLAAHCQGRMAAALNAAGLQGVLANEL